MRYFFPVSRGVTVFLLLLVTGALFGYQTFRGFWTRNELAGKVENLLPQISKDNHTAIRDQVVAAAKMLGIELLPDDVQVSYEPTKQLKFAQTFVQKLATFENYDATIVVQSPVRVWGITLSREPINVSKITQERAISRRQTELEETMKTMEAMPGGGGVQSGQQSAPPQPASPPPAHRSGSLQERARDLQNRPGLEQELNK